MEAARLRAEDSYAVLPLRSASGTWREPIVIDCEGSTVRVLPDGETVLMSEMEGLLARRSHPLVSLVRRRAAAIEEIPLRDGAPRVPYILFLVRPDGIHAYYQARALLESLGIAFGYELVGQDWKVQAPHSLAPRQVVDRVARAEPDEPTRLESRADVTPAGDDLHVWRAPKPASDAALGGGSDPGGRVLQPGDDPSLDPPMPQVADPRRPTGRAIDEGDLKGYTEVIPGRHTADEPTRRPSVREGTGTGVRAGGSDRKQADPGGTPDRPNAPTAERAGADPLAGLPRAPLSASGPEAWYDVSVICRAGEVVIQPGGYRITETMVNQGTLLTDRLRSIAAGAGGAQPRLRFVVEPGGEKLFWAVREQTTYADLDWPTTLKVMEGAALKHALGGRERDR